MDYGENDKQDWRQVHLAIYYICTHPEFPEWLLILRQLTADSKRDGTLSSCRLPNSRQHMKKLYTIVTNYLLFIFAFVCCVSIKSYLIFPKMYFWKFCRTISSFCNASLPLSLSVQLLPAKLI